MGVTEVENGRQGEGVRMWKSVAVGVTWPTIALSVDLVARIASAIQLHHELIVNEAEHNARSGCIIVPGSPSIDYNWVTL
jgi:hypothetical protein